MADIPIERRSGGNWWKWLLGLLVLVLVIWLVASMFGEGETGMEEGPAGDDPLEQPEEPPPGGEEEQPPGGDQPDEQPPGGEEGAFDMGSMPGFAAHVTAAPGHDLADS